MSTFNTTDSHVSQAQKFLSVSEIESRMPLLNQIAMDLVITWQRVLSARVELETVQATPMIARDHRRRDQIEELTEELNRLVDKTNGYIGEVESLGASMQEYKRGIINHPIQLDGRIVLVCWLPTDSKVAHYHELYECYEHRKSLKA